MKKSLLVVVLGLMIMVSEAQTNVTNFVVYPNPFECIATIKFDLSNSDSITLEMFNIMGSTARTLFNNTPLPPGSYSISLFGDSLIQGPYFLRLRNSDTLSLTKKLIKSGDCTTTSITETISLSKDFGISPNPATTSFAININEEMIGSTATVSDITGRKISAVQLITQNTSLITSSFTNGIYFITMENEKGRVTKKLVVQK